MAAVMRGDQNSTTPTYFYCYSLPLAIGSVINAGNWGRILRTYSQQANSNAWVLIRELIFEFVRREHFPAKPSRFESLFLCTTEAGLTTFRVNTGRHLDLGYEVELVDPDAPIHLGDWGAVSVQPAANMQTYEACAQAYWQGTDVVKPELVTTSPIRIVRILS